MTRATLCLVAAALLAACGAATGGTADPDWEKHRVENIDLSTTRGELGRSFRAELTWTDNYIDVPEIDISGLPPGLSFDHEKRVISGTPERKGFFTVNVAIRKKVERGELHRTTVDERWWTETFELEIYQPISD